MAKIAHFILIVIVVSILACIGVGSYFLWKYWWPIYMALPTVEYRDETIEQDNSPITPGTGGPRQPVIIQNQ